MEIYKSNLTLNDREIFILFKELFQYYILCYIMYLLYIMILKNANINT